MCKCNLCKQGIPEKIDGMWWCKYHREVFDIEEMDECWLFENVEEEECE